MRERLAHHVGTVDVAQRDRVTRRGDVGACDLRHLRDVVDDGIELARQPGHLVVVELDAREHAEMAHKIRGDFRHVPSLVAVLVVSPQTGGAGPMLGG